MNAHESRAKALFCARVEVVEPTVGAESSQNVYSPVRTEETDHRGFQVSGWKSLIDKHSLVFGLNLPFGVSMEIAGGLNGYSDGNFSLP